MDYFKEFLKKFIYFIKILIKKFRTFLDKIENKFKSLNSNKVQQLI